MAESEAAAVVAGIAGLSMEDAASALVAAKAELAQQAQKVAALEQSMALHAAASNAMPQSTSAVGGGDAGRWTKPWKDADWWTQWNGADVAASAEEKFALIRGVAEECIQDEELKQLIASKPHPVCYDGFEPSGRMHIAQGLQRSINVNRLTSAGVKFIFWVADYFALMNHKMGGDIEKIQVCGQYMIEVWKASGMDLTNVEFVWASEFMNNYGQDYWFNVIQIALKNNLSRIKRCCTIMGRENSDELSGAQIFYPCMQCNDVFMLKCDLTQLGMDQRKVNMLAREYADAAKIDKPVILSHHMLMGLGGQTKMAKSDPSSAIFMEDTEQDVNSKIKKAFCPEGQVDSNPCLEYIEYIVLPQLGKFTCVYKDGRKPKVYMSMDEIKADFLKQDEEGNWMLHPGDLKTALKAAINEMLQPVRDHFTEDPKAKELRAKVIGYMKEREREAKQAAKKKKQQGGGGGGKTKGAAADPNLVLNADGKPDASDPACINNLDIRVGFLKNCRKHPEADTLYVEDIDVGDATPRQVCSGLVAHIPLDQMEGPCLVVCNLKAAKMRGVESQAMVLAASSAVPEGGDPHACTIELLKPPEGAVVGERVSFGGVGVTPPPGQLPPRKKIWEALQPMLSTDKAGVAQWGEYAMTTSKGPVTCLTLFGCSIR